MRTQSSGGFAVGADSATLGTIISGLLHGVWHRPETGTVS